MSIEVQPPDTPVYSISGVLLDTFSHTSSFFNWHGWCHVSIIKGEQLFVFVKLGPSSRPFSVSLNWHFDYFSRRELYKMTFLCDFRAASTLYFFLHTDKRYLSDSVMRIFWFFMQFFLFGSKWKKRVYEKWYCFSLSWRYLEKQFTNVISVKGIKFGIIWMTISN